MSNKYFYYSWPQLIQSYIYRGQIDSLDYYHLLFLFTYYLSFILTIFYILISDSLSILYLQLYYLYLIS